ncbi:hypothetical protein [Mycobacterium sp.]|uniref:hypothetical protein n=1 Tax=Mycobacterium sp. TaxID=1785 RepID=UPI003D114EEB
MRVLDIMDPPKLPPELNQIVEFLAFAARGHGGALEPREFQRFKSDLIEAPQRWTVAQAPARSFERQCLMAGLSSADTDDLVALLRRAQRGEHMRVTSRFDRGHRYDLSDDWTPPDQSGPVR